MSTALRTPAVSCSFSLDASDRELKENIQAYLDRNRPVPRKEELFLTASGDGKHLQLGYTPRHAMDNHPRVLVAVARKGEPTPEDVLATLWDKQRERGIFLYLEDPLWR